MNTEVPIKQNDYIHYTISRILYMTFCQTNTKGPGGDILHSN